jgi:hypothetical protein
LKFRTEVSQNSILQRAAREVFSVSEGNFEKNLSLKRIAPSPKQSLQGDPRGCLRVFSILFDDIYSTFRKYDVAMCVRRAVRDSEFVHDGSPVFALHLFFLDVDEFDVVFHTDTVTRRANLSRLYGSVRMLSIGLLVPFTAPEISTLRPGKISVQESTGSVRI